MGIATSEPEKEDQGIGKTVDKVEISDLNPLAAEFVPQVGKMDTEPADPSGLVERDPTLP